MDIDSLPVIGVEATVHDTPDLVEPDVQGEEPFPHQLQVQCEEDIVGKTAAIVFEASLEQLLKYLKFPLKKCTWGDAEAEVACPAVSPFDCQIKKRGTAYVLEWVRPCCFSLQHFLLQDEC